MPTAQTSGGVTILNVTLGSKPTTVLLCNVVAVAAPLAPPQATTLVITPASSVISTQNGTVQLVATVTDQYGNAFTGATVTWVSSQPTFITVSGSGLATGIALGGAATITASVVGTSASGTATITTPVSRPTTLTLTVGEPTLATAAATAGWVMGTSVNDPALYEEHPGYTNQIYPQVAGAGGILTDESYKAGWISAVTSASAVTTNFKGAYDYDLAHAQAIGTAFKAYVLDLNNPAQWPGLTTFCTSAGNANTLLTAIATAITNHYNTPGSPAAYNGGTTYTYGNTVTFAGFKWTYIAQTNFSGITPALGAATASGEFAWIRTSAGAIHSYVIASDAIAAGVSGSNPFTTQLGAPSTWLPAFARAIFAGDPGALLEVDGTSFACDGTGQGTATQNSATLTLMAAIAAGGSVGGAGNLVVGLKGRVLCSLMQSKTGTVTQFNAAQFTTGLNAITSAGYKYAITEFAVIDDMFIGTGAAGIALRDTAIGAAYVNMVVACRVASATPDHFVIWQLRDPESTIVVQNISPRSDGLTQRPALFADFFGSTAANGTPIPTLKTSYYQTIAAVLGAFPTSITLNDAYQHLLYAVLVDQWGNPSSAPITFASSIPANVASNSSFVSAMRGGVSATVTASVVSPPLSASVTVNTAAPVLTAFAMTPAVATLSSGTIQLTFSGLDQYGLANATAPGTVSYQSSNTGIVTVNGSGVVSYVANGTTYVQAFNGVANGVSTITAQATLAPTISTITPSSTTLTTQGATQTLTATVVDQFGRTFPLTVPLVWSSSDASHIGVASTGITTAVATAIGTGGNAVITASIAGSSPLVSNTCTVSTPLTAATSIVLGLVGGTTINDGQGHTITPTVFDQFGNAMNTGVLVWATDNAQITVSQTGTIQALSGSQTAHITATQGAIVGTLTIVSGVPVLTKVVLSPGNATLSAGSITEVPTPSDQFGNQISFGGGGIGGALSLTASGTGYCANVASIQALTTCIAAVWRVRVDNWAALAGFNGIAVGTIDDGTGGGANRKISATLENNGTGLFRAGMSNANVNLHTGNIPAASMPANGQDVIVYAWYRSAAGGGDNHGVSVYKGDGSNQLIDPNATVLNTGNQGTIPGAGSNGQVGVNAAANTSVSRSMICQGVGVFNALRAAGSESSKPSVSDATCLYYCAMGDATSGTSPSSATAQIGANAMVPTVGQFAWTTDGSPGAWNGQAAAYTWASTNPAAATVDGSGHVNFVASGTTTVSALLNTTTATGSALITCSGVPIATTAIVNPTVVSLTAVGATAAVTLTVLDQFGNPMTLAGVTSSSSNTAVATVTASGTPIVVTAVSAGTATITVGAVINTIPVATSLVATVTTTTTFNQPGGMATVVVTGKMSAIPALFSIFSPVTPTATGETSANLTVTPPGTNNDTGLRITYPTNLTAGNSPVRFATPTFSAGALGFYYSRKRVRFSANFTTAGNPVVKLYEPQAQPHGSGAGATANPVFAAWASPFGNTKLVAAYLKQGPNGQFANYVPQTSPFIITDGNWHYVELLATPESSIGAGDGIIDIWVDIVNHFQQTGVQFTTGGMTAGFTNQLYDPVYGGTTSSPPVTMTVDFDDVFIATK